MQPFAQNVIAVVWDFDKTLTPEYMQAPLFKRFNVNETEFWAEVNQLQRFYETQGLTKVSKDTLYLTHMLTYVRQGLWKDLTNDVLRQLGADIRFFPGLPDVLPSLKAAVKNSDRHRRAEIEVEHYIVSTGLRQMILGSAIADHVDGIWACEFIEEYAPPYFLKKEKEQASQLALLDAPVPKQRSAKPILDIGYFIDNTTKTRALFELNKGVNKFDGLDVNAKMAPADRRIPFTNMIYVADGPSDVPCFSVLNSAGGRTFAVYDANSARGFITAKDLQDSQRVQAFGPADYTLASHTYKWLERSVLEIADRIASDFDASVYGRARRPPEHFVDSPKITNGVSKPV